MRKLLLPVALVAIAIPAMAQQPEPAREPRCEHPCREHSQQSAQPGRSCCRG